ncbi:hypothetical protein QBC43DRAFT_331823 [Cladorrhinum sp. PSN259]|nr:hypothetical protein QBC43DRAFT_331823 [Cladorrhinum sp. PSN259]
MLYSQGFLQLFVQLASALTACCSSNIKAHKRLGLSAQTRASPDLHPIIKHDAVEQSCQMRLGSSTQCQCLPIRPRLSLRQLRHRPESFRVPRFSDSQRGHAWARLGRSWAGLGSSRRAIAWGRYIDFDTIVVPVLLPFWAFLIAVRASVKVCGEVGEDLSQSLMILLDAVNGCGNVGVECSPPKYSPTTGLEDFTCPGRCHVEHGSGSSKVPYTTMYGDRCYLVIQGYSFFSNKNQVSPDILLKCLSIKLNLMIRSHGFGSSKPSKGDPLWKQQVPR